MLKRRLKLRSTRGEIHDFVKLGSLALQEMHKLDEARDAPIDFEKKQLKSFSRGMGEIIYALLNGTYRLIRYGFSLTERRERQRKTTLREEHMAASLRPKEAFALALDRIHEWQRQGLYLVAIPAATSNLGLLGHLAQHNHLNGFDPMTFPLVAGLNIGLIYYASRVSSAFNTLRVIEAGFHKLGGEQLGTEIRTIRKQLDHDARRRHPLTRLQRLIKGPAHD